MPEFSIAGDLPIRRLGFGAMRLTGPGVWGPPSDVPAARAVLRRVIELGINLIDTATCMGRANERLIRDTLAPFQRGIVVATKGGLTRTGPATASNPGMGVDNRSDRARARTVIPIATVQNEYNLANRKHEAVLDFCTEQGIGFIPFYPQRIGDLASREAMKAIATREQVTSAVVALAWLLAKAPTIIPIPGTSSVEHLAENVEASRVNLSSADMIALGGLTAEPA